MRCKTLFLALAGTVLAGAACLAQTQPAAPKSSDYPIQAGPFKPTFESFTRYKCPEWFRDAKLGMWAHWGPQSVPMDGDWYARNMYIQGSGQYKDHLEHYGHPSKHGYREIIDLWKAEKWDPDRLMALYKKAGAHYFVSMGCHHDNFDLWNSKFHSYNAVKMGPHRDVVGDWQKAAKKLGLRFGVSEHMGASFTWFQVAHGSDKTGPLAGVPYDGADPQYEELYHQKALPGDTGWYSNDPRWHKEWYRRIKDLVDNYHPDLLYTDGGVPFGNEVGRSMIAHLYNSSARAHGGRPEVVYTCKQQSKGMWVEDLERGVMAGIRPEPWQTDTSIGDWYYNRNWKYRDADWVLHMLADIVSKNGNLLINVVQRPDGTLDPEAEKILTEMAAWMSINSESIFGTRPWLVYGEGPIRAKGGSFGENYQYSARDVRFTTKGSRTLYAIALGWPEDRKLTIRSLAKFPEARARISDIKLLGYSGKVQWTQTADGLNVELPAAKPCDHAIVLKIAADDVRKFRPDLAMPQSPAIAADAAGNFSLKAEEADLHGDLKTEAQGGQPNIGFWDNPADYASWKLAVKEPGRYKVTVSCATIHPDAVFVVEAAGRKLQGKAATTSAWDQFKEVEVGTLELKQAGNQQVSLRARDAASWKAINLRWVKLTKVP